MKDLLTTYKLGWKTSYYQNTYDFKGADDPEETKEEVDNVAKDVNIVNTNGVNGHTNGDAKAVVEDDDEHCDACAI